MTTENQDKVVAGQPGGSALPDALVGPPTRPFVQDVPVTQLPISLVAKPFVGHNPGPPMENAPNTPAPVDETTRLPTVEELTQQVLGENISNPQSSRSGNSFSTLPSISPPSSSSISPPHAEYMRAQNEFIADQTHFLINRRDATYTEDVTAYSYAQTKFIEAQAKLLKYLGVL